MHLIAYQLTDLSVELATARSRDTFPLTLGRGDGTTYSGGGPIRVIGRRNAVHPRPLGSRPAHTFDQGELGES